MNPRTPRPSEVYARILEEFGACLHVARPGKVVSYDAATRTATVQPMVMTPLRTGEGEREVHELAAIHAVPVCWPGQVDLVAGDGVLLVFCDFDIGSWRDGGSKPADPGDESAHSPSGAVAIPGLDTASRKASEQSQYAALANKVDANFAELKQMFASWVVAPNDGGGALKTLSGSLSLPSVASSKVRVRQ